MLFSGGITGTLLSFCCTGLKIFHLAWFLLPAYSCWDLFFNFLVFSYWQVLLIMPPTMFLFLNISHLISILACIGLKFTVPLGLKSLDTESLSEELGRELLCLFNLFLSRRPPLRPGLWFAWFKMLPVQVIQGWQGMVLWSQAFHMIYFYYEPSKLGAITGQIGSPDTFV